MTEKRRLNLAFSMASPCQKEVWWFLSSIPAGQRTETVCRMVLECRDQSNFLEAVRAVVREELQNCKITAPKEEQSPASPEPEPEAEAIDGGILDFLMALHDDTDDT